MGRDQGSSGRTSGPDRIGAPRPEPAGAPSTGRAGGSGYLALAVLVGVALAVRLPHLGGAPQYDELLHLLAARSWLREGTFRIGDGLYTRTPAFTIIVAGFLKAFGAGVVQARLPALLAGLGWTAAVFVWTRREVGVAEGWVAGLLFALAPGSIHLSQFARFYTLHGLLFFGGAVLTYRLVHGPDNAFSRLRTGTAAALCLALATYFQVTTLIGLAALAAWMALEASLRPDRLAARLGGDRRRLALVAAILVVLAVSAAALRSGVPGRLWHEYRTPAAWARPTADTVRYYAWLLLERYPTLWTLFPVAVIGALARRRNPALFGGVLFSVGLVLQSLGAQKAERYLYFLMPFFFIVWSIALVAAWRWLRPRAEEALDRLAGRSLPHGLRTGAGTALAVGACLFIAASNHAFPMTAQLLVQEGRSRPYSNPDWPAAAARLDRLVRSSDVFVTSITPAPFYYVRAPDALIGPQPTEYGHREPAAEFTVDTRFGRPVISRPGSLSRILACYPSGVVVVEDDYWAVDTGVRTSVTDILRRRAEPVEVPDGWALRVFRWGAKTPRRSAADASPSRACPPPHMPAADRRSP